MSKIEQGTAVLLSRAGGVYLSQRIGCKTFKNGWQACGGRLEENEEPRDCAKREIKEEADLDVEIGRIKYLGSEACERDQGDVNMVVHFYVLELQDGEMPKNMEPDLHSDWEWVPKSEVKDRNILSGLRTETVRKELEGP